VNRRDLFNRIVGICLAPKVLSTPISGAASQYLTAPINLKWKHLAGKVSSLQPLNLEYTLLSSVISKPPLLEVFSKNIHKDIANVQDTTIINSQIQTIGVNIYMDPSGIFTNIYEIYV
jgi:hypothetical protein